MKILLVLLLSVTAMFGQSREEKRLQRVVHQYQHKLQMDDWVIAVKIAHKGMPPGVMGFSKFNPQDGMGVIYVRGAKDYTKAQKLRIKSIQRDQDNTMVQEMIYCILTNYPPEQALHMISGSLVTGDRKLHKIPAAAAGDKI